MAEKTVQQGGSSTPPQQASQGQANGSQHQQQGAKTVFKDWASI